LKTSSSKRIPEFEPSAFVGIPDRSRVDELEAERVGHEPRKKLVGDGDEVREVRGAGVRRLEVQPTAPGMAIPMQRVMSVLTCF
jgi:hypothetical protein